MEFAKKHSAAIAGALIVASVFFTVGFRRGKVAGEHSAVASNLLNTSNGETSQVDFSPFWKAWGIINKQYVPTSSTTKPVNDQTRVWGAIQGMVASLGDPYTVFFPPVESKQFASDIKGSFSGVGMEVGLRDGLLTVVAPLKGSPAAAAGLRAGDKILKVDSKDTAKLTTEQAVTLIRGEVGTTVTFLVSRNGKTPFEVKVTRAIINIPVVDTKDLENGIFYIALYSFTENSADLFRGALREFVLSGSKKLILDLRGNPGGYLESALDMASWFLPSGTVVIREDYASDKEETVFRSKGYDVFNESLKMVILVDNGSASASEILAGALSEYDIATLIGEKTFGKGSVQELVPVTGETSLKVTIARWLTPNGFSISESGITPDIEVKITEEDRKANRDAQLNRAIEFLTTGK